MKRADAGGFSLNGLLIFQKVKAFLIVKGKGQDFDIPFTELTVVRLCPKMPMEETTFNLEDEWS